MAKITIEERAEILSMAAQARSDLYLGGFLTERENDKIHAKIKKYQDKYKIDGSLVKTRYNS